MTWQPGQLGGHFIGGVEDRRDAEVIPDPGRSVLQSLVGWQRGSRNIVTEDVENGEGVSHRLNPRRIDLLELVDIIEDGVELLRHRRQLSVG